MAESSSSAIARQKAKDALRASARARQATRRSASPPRPGGNGQPKSSRDAVKGSIGVADEVQKLAKDPRLGKYFDYDLSKMVNSRGGFLVEDDSDLSERAAIEKKRREERQKATASGAWEPGMDVDRGPRCVECKTLEIDNKFHETFGISLCQNCKKGNPERYSLLTKTECREDYLLTDPELKDEEALPHLLRPNPHGGAYSNMMLYLRVQVEKFAFDKWGGPEGLDEEYEKREKDKRDKRDKKFQKGLRELRSRTKNNPYQVRLDAEHHHELEVVPDEGVKRCECGFEVEIEIL